jgi:hypothetical protein
MRDLREKALASIQQSSAPGFVPNQRYETPWALDELLGSPPSYGSSSNIEGDRGPQLCTS